MPLFSSYTDLLKTLQKRQFLPIYFLHGEESYYIDELSKYIEHHALSEMEKSFNLTVLYGKDIDFKIILDNVKRYPVMAERQVVIVKEAQELKTLDNLAPYFEKPIDSTILVLAHKHKAIDKRKKWAKDLEKSDKIALFESKKLYENQVPEWIHRHLANGKYKIEDGAAELLAQYLGTDLAKVANELDKLMLNIPATVTINKDHIQQNIGISKEFNVYELQAALGKKEGYKANQIVQYFIANPKDNALPAVIGALYNYFSKAYMFHFLKSRNDQDAAKEMGVSPFFLKDYKAVLQHYNLGQLENAIHTLRDYDLRSKGVNLQLKDDLLFSESADYDALLTEMVYKIMH